MKVLLPIVLGFVMAASAVAQAPVNDISTSRRGSVSGGIAVEQDSGSATTYGASDSGYSAGESRAASSSNGGGYSSSSSNSRSASTASGGTDNMALYRQFQQLQEEVAALRSQVEEQGYQLQKLKQQPESAASAERPVSGTGASAPVATESPVAAPASNTEGVSDYEAAYAKLKAKDYDGATAAFKAFVAKYPTSEYAGNAYFWLGFVYQTKGDMDNAGKSFSALIDRFPAHAKVDDAKYNLGKIYHQQGNKEKARTLLKEVAAGTSKSAPLAKSYMESM